MVCEGEIAVSIATSELLHHLIDSKDIKKFIDDYETEFLNVTCSEFLQNYIEQKHLSISSVCRNSGQGDYVYKVISGQRKPSRDVIAAIAVGMGITLDETQLLLRISKFAVLDPRDKRDSIIIYGIKEHKNIMELNELLYDMNAETL